MRFFTVVDEESRQQVRDYVTGRKGNDAAARVIQDKIDTTRWIVDTVRAKGDAAVMDFTERFDGVALTPEQFELKPEEIDAAIRSVDAGFVGILQRAHDNIRRFHAKYLRESWEETYDDGTVLGQRILPIGRAGVYVPGGKAFYPSSVLMNIAPARVAGVREIVMVSPPSYAGSIHPAVLAAARIAGATRVFRIGGAQAIAALAFGTETIPAVDKITGPGNLYVTAAKAVVRGVVEIDSEAGPSEVVVLADKTARPEHVMAEMLAQAEHDEDAMAVLITTSPELAASVCQRLTGEAERLPRRDIISKSLETNAAVILVQTIEDAIEFTDLFAPEHLSIQTEFPRKIADKIQNAGAMMLGALTPVAVGDYYAGPNHILPTGRRARFSSPLTAEDFRKVTSILYYSKERLQQDAADIQAFAELEGLKAHARSVEVRL